MRQQAGVRIALTAFALLLGFFGGYQFALSRESGSPGAEVIQTRNGGYILKTSDGAVQGCGVGRGALHEPFVTVLGKLGCYLAGEGYRAPVYRDWLGRGSMFTARFRRQLFIIGLCWASYFMVDWFRLAAILSIGLLQYAKQAAPCASTEEGTPDRVHGMGTSD